MASLKDGSVPPLPGPEEERYYTADSGLPVQDPQASQRIGRQLPGTLLFQDINLIETLSHITHERIPERVVHAKAAGAYGEFECTRAMTDVSSADFINTVGKKTKLFVRFSTVNGGRGSADTVRDNRGFAFKLYTEEGNLDWLFFSEPVFPIRDGGKFPSFVHVNKADPKSNIPNLSYTWDFNSSNPETFHALMMIYSDRGTPKSYRQSEIFGLNTYRFTKEDGSYVYTKIHMKPVGEWNNGVANLNIMQATVLAGQDPDYHTRDLYDHIEHGKYPVWEVSAQIMDPNKDPGFNFNKFDPTKVWPQGQFPLIPFGRITLNENVTNYFSEVEQAAFTPTAIVPGWDISPDPILQTRLFAYGETQRYRLGINFYQFPVNKARNFEYNPTKRDGAGNVTNYGSAPNYIGSHFGPKVGTKGPYPKVSSQVYDGAAINFISEVSDIDYEQPRALWKMYIETKQDQALVTNVSIDLSRAKVEIRDQTYAIFEKISPDLASRIKDATEKLVPHPVTHKPFLDLVNVDVPNGTSLMGGKPDKYDPKTA